MSTLWKVFIDDSADGLRKKYVMAGALIQKKAVWHDFDKQWRRVLRNAPRIAHFHGKEFSSLGGEFSQFKDLSRWPIPTGKVAAQSKRDALRKVISDSSLLAIGVGVLVDDYERVRCSHVLGNTHMSRDPYEWALQHVLLRSVRAIKKADLNARIAFISDDSNKAARYTELYSSFKRKNPDLARSMLGIAHVDDKAWSGIQAADMIASTVKKAYDDKYEKGDIDPNIPLLESFYQIHVVNEQYLLEVLDTQSEMGSNDGTGKLRRRDEEDSFGFKDRIAAHD